MMLFSNKYKLKFGSNPRWVEIGEDGADFIHNMITIKYKFKVID